MVINRTPVRSVFVPPIKRKISNIYTYVIYYQNYTINQQSHYQIQVLPNYRPTHPISLNFLVSGLKIAFASLLTAETCYFGFGGHLLLSYTY